MPPAVAGPFSQHRLPRGRHGIPPEQVHANQRWRLLGACAEIIAEGGYGRLTVSGVAAGAGVSKVTFYKHFGELSKCILATYDMASASTFAVLLEACESAEDPAAELPAVVASTLEFLARNPPVAHVLTDAGLDGVQALHGPRAEFADRCASLLSAVRPERGSGQHPHLPVHHVRAAKGWIADRLFAGSADALPQRAPELARLLSS